MLNFEGKTLPIYHARGDEADTIKIVRGRTYRVEQDRAGETQRTEEINLGET